MLSRSNWTILGLAVIAAAVGGYAQHRIQASREAAVQPAPTVVGQPVPAISLLDVDGKRHALSDYRGRRVLVNFWASWCAPCVKEMPALAKAREKFGEREAIVLGIAMDEPSHVRAFLAAHPVSYPILMGQVTSPSTSFEFGNTTGNLPYSVLIGEDGRILATHEGAMSMAQAEQWLTP